MENNRIEGKNEDRTGQDRTGKDRIRQDRTKQDEKEKKSVEPCCMRCMDVIYLYCVNSRILSHIQCICALHNVLKHMYINIILFWK